MASGTVGTEFENSTWCCPASSPGFSVFVSTFSNDAGILAANGQRFQSIPSCLSCQGVPTASGYSQLCSQTASYWQYSTNNFVVSSIFDCCQQTYNCQLGWTCSSSSSSSRMDPSAIRAVPAVEVVSPLLDLCHFVLASNGSIVAGSPCMPQITCEAYSPTQYRCLTCTDPRVGPPGSCRTFSCPPGQYCPGFLSANVYDPSATLKIQNITCPIGSYCPSGSATPTPCSIGQYCAVPGLVAAAPCTKGYFCPNTTSIIGCPVGYFCPLGSVHPIACPTGTLCNSTHVGVPVVPTDSSSPMPCSGNQLCSSSTGRSYPTTCSSGYYCPSPATSYVCTPGNYCPAGSSEPIPCAAGTYCDQYFMSDPTDCNPGYYCNDGVTQGECPIGSVCPQYNMGEPTACVPPEYCPSLGMIYASQCPVGTYCASSSMAVACPAGNYCPIGSIAPISCESGHFTDVMGAVYCSPCNQWVTSNAGATSCNKPTPLSICLICLGIVVVIGGVFLVRYCIVRQKKQDAMQTELRMQQARVDQKMAEERHRQAVVAGEQQQLRTQQAAAMLHVEAERQRLATVVEFQTSRIRVKSEMMERLMRDLRTELKLYYPESNEAGAINNPSQQLVQYEQLLSDIITPQFDNESCELFAVLNMLVANPYKYSAVEFHGCLMGIRTLAIESFPAFRASTVGSPLAGSFQLQSIRDNLMRELSRHVQVWLVKASAQAIVDNKNVHIAGPAAPPQVQPLVPRPVQPVIPSPMNPHAQPSRAVPPHAPPAPLVPQYVQPPSQPVAQYVQPQPPAPVSHDHAANISVPVYPVNAVRAPPASALPHASEDAQIFSPTRFVAPPSEAAAQFRIPSAPSAMDLQNAQMPLPLPGAPAES